MRDPAKTIPLVLWASDCYTQDGSGKREHDGPQFFLSWTDNEEIETYRYLVDEHDGRLAIGPAEVFREGSPVIGCRGGRLTLE